MNCGNEAAKTGVGRFVEVSTAQVYECDKVRVGETEEGRRREGGRKEEGRREGEEGG